VVVQIEAVPRTLTGKKMEVPIRKLLLGADVHKVITPQAMQNPDSLPFFIDYAQRMAQRA
jgi:acetoacetyl-CoA synthetase